MQNIQNSKLPALYLRLAIGSAYLWEVADRLGILGAHGRPHVGWGDWAHFLAYAQQVMRFLPAGLVPVLAVVATIGEALFGLLILIGLFTRFAAIGSGILSFCFAVAMAISFGIDSPLGYSVFTLSAASLLLATLPQYDWSLDSFFERNKLNRRLIKSSLVIILLPGFAIVANGQPARDHSTSAAGKITEQYLLQQFLNENGITYKEVQIEVVTFPPGSTSPAHRHPCPMFGYVLEGEIESVFEAKYHLYKMGDAFYEKTNGLHSVTRNKDIKKPARLLVFFINQPQKPNSIRVK
jgi:putative oxidoreductase